jgi:hypothetical protein
VCTGPPVPVCEEDADCIDDTLFCNGEEICVDEVCDHSGDPCLPDLTCDEDEKLCKEIEIPLPCEISIEPSSAEVASGDTMSFTVEPEGECGDPTYEWSVESTLRSSVDQNGTYKAGCTLFNAASDVVSVVDSGNGNIIAEATITVSPKCTLVKIYGENSKEVKILRLFRDNVLSKTPEGQEIIRLYYQWSPAIVKAMERDEEFKEEVKEMIDGILGLIPEKAE